MSFQPEGKKWQPLYYQFGCMARTQLVYAQAARKGKMDFALFSQNALPSKNAAQTREWLLAFLDEAEHIWQQALAANDAGVQWPDAGKVSLAQHIARLAEHGRLHHGQLISYFTLAGFELPGGFKNNWAL